MKSNLVGNNCDSIDTKDTYDGDDKDNDDDNDGNDNDNDGNNGLSLMITTMTFTRGVSYRRGRSKPGR